MMSNDDDLEWLNAGVALANPPHDPSHFVALLRSGRPIPNGARDMLAEMLDPNGPGYLHLRLIVSNTETKTRNIAIDNENLAIVSEYRKHMEAGKSSQEAAIETGEKFGCSDREVYRRIKDWKMLAQWLSII
jgi:hypothetical protein